MGLLSITAAAEGYQAATVYSPAQIITVTLQANGKPQKERAEGRSP